MFAEEEFGSVEFAYSDETPPPFDVLVAVTAAAPDFVYLVDLSPYQPD